MDFLKRLKTWVEARFPDGLPPTSQTLYELVVQHQGKKAYVDTFVMMLRDETDVDLETDPDWLASANRFAESVDRFAPRRTPQEAPAYVEAVATYLANNSGGVHPAQAFPQEWKNFVQYPNDFEVFKTLANRWSFYRGPRHLIQNIPGLPASWQRLSLEDLRTIRTPPIKIAEDRPLERYGQWLLEQSTDPNSPQSQIHLLRLENTAFGNTRADELEQALLAEEATLLAAIPQEQGGKEDPILIKLFALSAYHGLVGARPFEVDIIRSAVGENLLAIVDRIEGVEPFNEVNIWGRDAEATLGFSLTQLPEQTQLAPEVRIGGRYMRFLERQKGRSFVFLRFFIDAASKNVPEEIVHYLVNHGVTEEVVLQAVRQQFQTIRAFAEQLNPELRGLSTEELLAYLDTALEAYWEYLKASPDNDLQHLATIEERNVEQLREPWNFAYIFEGFEETAELEAGSDVADIVPFAGNTEQRIARPGEPGFLRQLSNLLFRFRMVHQPNWNVEGRGWFEQRLGNTSTAIGLQQDSVLHCIDPDAADNDFYDFLQEHGPVEWRSLSRAELKTSISGSEVRAFLAQNAVANLQASGTNEEHPFFRLMQAIAERRADEFQAELDAEGAGDEVSVTEQGTPQIFAPNAGAADDTAKIIKDAANPANHDLAKDTPGKPKPENEGYAATDDEPTLPKAIGGDKVELKLPPLPGREINDEVQELMNNGRLTNRGLLQLQNVLNKNRQQPLALPNAQGAVAVLASAQATNEAAAASTAIARLAKAFEVFFVLAK